MTTDKTNEAGSTTTTIIDDLAEQIKAVRNAPPYLRGNIAARASDTIVLALRDLDRRIQQLEISASDQQNHRHGDLPAL